MPGFCCGGCRADHAPLWRETGRFPKVGPGGAGCAALACIDYHKRDGTPTRVRESGKGGSTICAASVYGFGVDCGGRHLSSFAFVAAAGVYSFRINIGWRHPASSGCDAAASVCSFWVDSGWRHLASFGCVIVAGVYSVRVDSGGRRLASSRCVAAASVCSFWVDSGWRHLASSGCAAALKPKEPRSTCRGVAGFSSVGRPGYRQARRCCSVRECKSAPWGRKGPRRDRRKCGDGAPSRIASG